MKNGKNPTREQKKLMIKWKLDPTMWLVVKDTPERMELIHRHFDRTKKIIPKGERDERCLRQEERIERVAAVSRCRGASAPKADAGHRNRSDGLPHQSADWFAMTRKGGSKDG